MSTQAFSGSTESPDQLATVLTAATPHTNSWLAHSEMNCLAPCTFCLPLGCFFNRHWDAGLPCRIAHKLKRQRHTGHTPTSVSGYTLRTLVFVVRLVAGFTGGLPVAGHHDSFVACVTSTRRGSEFLCHSLPDWTVASFRASKGMSNFMQQRIENFFGRIVSSVILSDLNSSRPVIARTLPTFCLGPSK